ncbi:MAG: phosphopantetheinyl transferase [Bacteroidetes bacterium]|nr:phosphopantetheinyl transferase [Bacteroidota bacterium]
MQNYKIIQVSASSRYALLDVSGFEASSKRNLEAEGIRFLLDKLLPGQGYKLSYYDTGKPYLEGRKERLSISHSHNMVAVMIDEQKETGIDIELIRDKVLNVTHKYLDDKERENIEAADIEKHLVYWAAKETLYKIYGRKKVDFKEHLFIEPFSYNGSVGGLITGHIRLPELREKFRLHYEKLDDYILVYLI